MPRSRITALVLTLVLGVISASFGEDKASTEKQIEQAQQAFEVENIEIRAEIGREIDAKEAAERKRAKPDLERIKGFKTDREQLEGGTLPNWISSKIKTRIKKNVTTLINVLSTAKSDSLRNKDDQTAETLDKEIEKLKAHPGLGAEKSAGIEKSSNSIKVSAGKSSKAANKAKMWPKNAPEFAVAPFAADRAEQLQAAWATYLKINVDYTNKLGMKFRLIPPGEFLMGNTPEEIEAVLKISGDENFRASFRSEAPQHVVMLTRPVYLSIHEVTQAQYEKVMGTNPSHYSKTGRNKNDVANIDTSDNPVETASWLDAAEFCSRLSVMEKLHPFYNRSGDKVEYYDGNGYRLPTEAEWEFACKAGTTTRYWSGDKDDDLRALGIGWHWGGRPQTVGTLKANPFGLHDTVGNVREWVDDCWDASWYSRFRDTPAIDPRCPSLGGSEHVVRGGCYGDSPITCRSSARIARAATNRGPDIGFRVVLTVTAAK